MEITLAITNDGRFFEMEGDRTIEVTNTASQIDRLIEALQFSQADIFVVLTPGEERPVPRGYRTSTRNIN
ncbi:hypothetical protein [Trichocoleus sp. DQ-U1]|uniref:hypothetical protein n=1 Tax=Trichocoleus sp. DQ-U1 TaxID=2933926 RepID=UPI003297DAD6